MGNTKSATMDEISTKRQPPYNIVLHDDDDHTFDYVIAMLQELFHHTKTKSTQLAKELDESGDVVVKTTTKEYAEFLQDRVHAYGPDKLIPQCSGAMTCTISPAM
jgi:ATP-dependent Clp protease adaptor protein ClpS